MARITITLTLEEKAALASYARLHRRDPRDQAAIELQQVLTLAGYLGQPIIKAAAPTGSLARSAAGAQPAQAPTR